jgi:hypothetical protein
VITCHFDGSGGEPAAPLNSSLQTSVELLGGLPVLVVLMLVAVLVVVVVVVVVVVLGVRVLVDVVVVLVVVVLLLPPFLGCPLGTAREAAARCALWW